jgi:hypothetical protein
MLKLPTDNLYKFMAIFGLVLTVTGLYLDVQMGRESNEALISVMVEDARVSDTMLAQSKKGLDLVQQLKAHNPNTPEGARAQTELLNEMKSLNAHWEHLRRKAPYITAKRRYDHISAEYSTLAFRIPLLLIGGIFLSGLGFWLWYVRVQKFLDKGLSEPKATDETDA